MKEVVIKKLEAILDEAQRAGMYGTIELQLKAGEVELIRTSRTELMPNNNREKTHNGPRFR
jgi:hypothetical protein